jgi:hypothetical protein
MANIDKNDCNQIYNTYKTINFIKKYTPHMSGFTDVNILSPEHNPEFKKFVSQYKECIKYNPNLVNEYKPFEPFRTVIRGTVIMLPIIAVCRIFTRNFGYKDVFASSSAYLLERYFDPFRITDINENSKDNQPK